MTSYKHIPQQDDFEKGNVQIKRPLPKNMLIIGAVGVALTVIDAIFLAGPSYSFRLMNLSGIIVAGILSDIITTICYIYRIHCGDTTGHFTGYGIVKEYLIVRLGVILACQALLSGVVMFVARRYIKYEDIDSRIMYCAVQIIIFLVYLLMVFCCMMKHIFFAMKEFINTYDFNRIE